MTEAIFTPEQLAEIQAYHQPQYVWGAVGDVVNLVVVLLLLRFLVRPLYARCAALGPWWAVALAFVLSYFVITSLLYLPLDLYFDYFHEHAFGMSKYTPASFAIDHLKGVATTIGALTALTIGMFGLARRLRLWWAVLGAVGAVVLLFSAAIDPYRARVLFAQKPLPAGELRDRITTLMQKANVDFSDVLVEDNSHATVRLGAYFAGTGPTRTIVLNGALLQQLTVDEVLAAVAHESGHVHESKWPARIASALTLVAFLFLVDRLMRWVARRGFWGVTEFPDVRALPLIMLVFSLGTTVAKPVSGAFSRAREREADRYALQLTGDPDAFASMLVKAARVNKMDPDPPWWVTLKSRSHPSIRERLEAVDAWRAKTNGG